MKRFNVVAGRNTEMAHKMDAIKETSRLTNSGSQSHFPLVHHQTNMSDNRTENTSAGFNNVDTSLLDYRLKIARQQEEEEVARSQRHKVHHRLRPDNTSGSRERKTKESYPQHSMSPLRIDRNQVHRATTYENPQQQLFQQHSNHSSHSVHQMSVDKHEGAFKRTKSVEKDNKEGRPPSN